MRAWSLLLSLLSAAWWLAGKLGHRPEIPEEVALDLALFALALVATLAYLVWRRLRAFQAAAGLAVVLLASTAFYLFHFLHEVGEIGSGTYHDWFVPAFLGWVLAGIAGAILFALDRIDHPRRWKLVAEHAATCSFFESLLFRDIPDIRDHEDVDF
ncbi:MAG: hypothetical protein PVG07_10545 [Acidobacteriota bacterium]|jgi:hypothetical protein